MTVGSGVPDTSPERVGKNADDGNGDDDEEKVDSKDFENVYNT